MKIFNLDAALKTHLGDGFTRASLFNNCITHFKENLYFMTFRINYSGLNSPLTDPDSLLHPWYFWDKEKYEGNRIEFLRVKLTKLLESDHEDAANKIDNSRFLGTGLALLEYKDGDFIVKSAGNLFQMYGFHDTRVVYSNTTDTNILTFYYTKNNYGNLSAEQLKNASRRFPREAGTNKLIDIYYAKNKTYLDEKFASKSNVALDDVSTPFKIKTFIGKVSYEFNHSDEFDLADCVSKINGKLSTGIEPCNIYMNTFIERNWIPTHPEMIYPKGSYFHGMNGILTIVTTPSGAAKNYSTTVLTSETNEAEENTLYYNSIPALANMKNYLNQFIDDKTFYRFSIK